jgi:hypothetical protein
MDKEIGLGSTESGECCYSDETIAHFSSLARIMDGRNFNETEGPQLRISTHLEGRPRNNTSTDDKVCTECLLPCPGKGNCGHYLSHR